MNNASKKISNENQSKITSMLLWSLENIQPNERKDTSICLEAIAEEELLMAARSTLTLEELVESPTAAKPTRVSLETATGTALPAHGVIRIVAIVISRP